MAVLSWMIYLKWKRSLKVWGHIPIYLILQWDSLSPQKHLWLIDTRRAYQRLLTSNQLDRFWRPICMAETAGALPIIIFSFFLSTEPWLYSGKAPWRAWICALWPSPNFSFLLSGLCGSGPPKCLWGWKRHNRVCGTEGQKESSCLMIMEPTSRFVYVWTIKVYLLDTVILDFLLWLIWF